MRPCSDSQAAVPAAPKKSERPDIAYVSGPVAIGHGRTEPTLETWVVAPVGDGVWKIGYLIATTAGTPRVAEVRLTPCDPWTDQRLRPSQPGPMPSLERAQRVLSPKAALELWIEENERIDAAPAGYWLQHAPQQHGFNPRVVQRPARPDDAYYALFARRLVEIKNVDSRYAQTLADEFGLSGPGTARTWARRCRERGLVADDRLTDYARSLPLRAPYETPAGLSGC